MSDLWKQAAAQAAVARVEDGMVLGLGTGSTAAFALEALGARVRDDGLKVMGVPTSERTAEAARRLGIPLTGFADHPVLDLTIDGADEVERGTLYLLKGGGGALLREKIVAAASRRVVIAVDRSKLVDRLGAFRLPVEVEPFGAEATILRLRGLGAEVELRRGKDGAPFRSDGGHLVCDCAFGTIEAPAELERRIKAMVGVIDCGLFIDLAHEVVIGGPDGVETLTRS